MALEDDVSPNSEMIEVRTGQAYSAAFAGGAAAGALTRLNRSTIRVPA
jgi:hypothetical protein